MCEIFKTKTDRGILFLCWHTWYVSKGYGLVILEECSAETIFTGISPEDKGLHTVIISQSGPEKHVANPGLQAVEILVSGGVQVPTCHLLS